VPVDADGLDVAAGIRTAPRARFALVTPSHQAPLGVTLSLSRRLALLSWATRARAWVIEDDYDAEFRYVGRPLPPLASLDRGGRVLYCGSFSKVMLPGLRLGYVVVPRHAATRFARAADLLAPSASLVDQMALSDFLADGYFARHVRRMRKLYAERRAALAAALAAECGGRLRVALQAGGMHLVAWLRRGEDDMALARRAAAHGLAPHALSPWRLRTRGDPALLLGFTNLPAEAARAEVARLRQAIA
jgi:GntR family transcriptional regulator/MocR family aminotransferase